MKHLWVLLAFVVVGLTLCGPPHFGAQIAGAQVTPVPCGTPVYLPSPGTPVKGLPLSSELNHLETCAASAAVQTGGYPTPIVSSSPGVTVATVGGAATTYIVGINNGNCLAIIAAQEAYNCATPGPQATPSPTASTCAIWSGSWPYTNALDVTCSPTWTGQHIFNPSSNETAVLVEPSPTSTASASPVPCLGPSGAGSGTVPNGVLCLGPNGMTSAANTGTTGGGLVLGKALGSATWNQASGGTSNSMALTFVRNNGAGDFLCSIYLSSGGALSFATGSGCTSMSIANPLTTGTNTITSGPLLQGAACAGTTPQTGGAGNYQCRITASSSAWSYVFSRTYTSGNHPACFVSDDDGGTVLVTAYAGSSGAWTGCSGTTSGASDHVEVMVIGNAS